MGIYDIKPMFQKFLEPVKNVCIKLDIPPSVLNFLGFLVSVAMGAMLYYANRDDAFLILIPIAAFVRTALNALDGMVARDTKAKNQKFGEVINEFSDRISDAVIFMGLALAPYSSLALGAIVTVIVLLNSYLSIVSKAAGGSRQYGGFMGKADRMLYIGLASLAVFIFDNTKIFHYILYFIGVGTLLTMLQRFIVIRRELVK